MLFKLNYVRARVRLREFCPIWTLLALFLLGQLLGHFVYAFKIEKTAVLFLGLMALLVGRLRFFTLILLVGILSMLSVFPPLVDVDTTEDTTFVGRVVREPRYRRPGEIELEITIEGVLNKQQEFTALSTSTFKSLCKGADVPWRNLRYLSVGSLFGFQAKFRTLKPEVSPFHYRSSLLRRGVSSTCRIKLATRPFETDPSLVFQARELLRRELVGVLGNNERAGLLLSMGFGIRDVLSHQTEEVFRKTGLAHLLVVSGYQVSLFFIASLWLSRLLFLQLNFFYHRGMVPVLSCGTASISAFLFVALVGFDDSALRALFGLLLYAAASMLERGEKRFQLLAASALLLAFFWPGCWLGPSFQLTYAALLGIYLGAGSAGSLSFKSFILTNLFASFFAAVVAGVWFARLSLIGLILNPLFASLASFVSCKIGFAAVLAKIIGIDPAGFCIRIVSWILVAFRNMIEALAANSLISFLYLEVSWVLLIFCFAVAAAPIYKYLESFFNEYNCVRTKNG